MHTTKEYNNKPAKKISTAKTATLYELVDAAATTIDYDGSNSGWYLTTLNIIYFFKMILSISTKKAFLCTIFCIVVLCTSTYPDEDNSKNKGIQNEG